MMYELMTWPVMSLNVILSVILTMTLTVVLIVRAWAVRRLASESSDLQSANLTHAAISVVIPLKGWDTSLPALITALLEDSHTGALEVILVVDAEHPRRGELPQDSRFRLMTPPPRPPEWRDKNWRLYQGASSARYGVILFLDSDVVPTPELLTRRLSAHSGDLSFCLPIYASPERASERFLSAFTSLNNLFIYGVGFAIAELPTAIGPSMLSTSPRESLLEALHAGRSAIADDHALAHHLTRLGLKVSLARVPVIVGKDGETWAEVSRQIIRWLTLPRTVRGQLTPQIVLIGICVLTLNSASTVCFWSGLIGALCGLGWAYTSLTLGLYIALLEGALLMWAEAAWTRRLSLSSLNDAHLLFTPIVLATQPVFAVIGALKREIRWRGEVTRL